MTRPQRARSSRAKRENGEAFLESRGVLFIRGPTTQFHRCADGLALGCSQPTSCRTGTALGRNAANRAVEAHPQRTPQQPH